LDEYESNSPQPVHAVILLNVLEHVEDPVDVVQNVLPHMMDASIVVIRVPNDFSPLQLAAQKKLDKEAWWVAPPDHIQYFNFASMEQFLDVLGLEIVDRLSDFPMELFLLFGEDYVGNREAGSACHKKRRLFELSISKELRRGIYRSFAQNGIGRNMLVFAKKRGS
jgi:hypothetical protein